MGLGCAMKKILRNPLFVKIEETLAYQSLKERTRHRLVVLAGVTDVGKDLSQRLFVVDVDEVAVFLQLFLGAVIAVDVHAQIVVVTLLVDESLDG